MSKPDKRAWPTAKAEKQRTTQQNKALHLYFQLLSERLNEAGLDMRTVLKPEVEIPWTKESVKEYLWRPIQRLQLLKASTTDLSTTDIDAVYATLNRFLSEKFSMFEEFPSWEAMMERADQYYEDHKKKSDE